MWLKYDFVYWLIVIVEYWYLYDFKKYFKGLNCLYNILYFIICVIVYDIND